MKLLIAIPAKNECCTIGKIVRASKRYGHVIVVDDDSNDSTAVEALKNGAKVIAPTLFTGYSGAILSAFDYALLNNFDYLITLDGDGEHNTSEIEDIIKAFQSGYEFVINERGSLPRFGEKLVRIYSLIRYGAKDIFSGFKGYKTIHIKNLKFNPKKDPYFALLTCYLLELNIATKKIKSRYSLKRKGEARINNNLFTKSCLKLIINDLKRPKCSY